jgi:hypothetical protein
MAMTITGRHINPRNNGVMTVRAISPLRWRVVVKHDGHEPSGDIGFGLNREQVAAWVSEWTAA